MRDEAARSKILQAIGDGAQTMMEITDKTGLTNKLVANRVYHLANNKLLTRKNGQYSLTALGKKSMNGNGAASRAMPSRPLGPTSLAVLQAIKNGAATNDAIMQLTGKESGAIYSAVYFLKRKNIITGKNGSFAIRDGVDPVTYTNGAASHPAVLAPDMLSGSPEIRQLKATLMKALDQVNALEKNVVPAKQKKMITELAKRLGM